MHFKNILFIFFFLIPLSGFSQKKFDFRFWEDSLVTLRNQVLNTTDETERFALNEEFMTLLESILRENGSFKFTWDSVTNFTVTTAPDHFIRFFTWHISRNNFSVENFGFLQINTGGKGGSILYPLYDKKNRIDYPESFIGDQSMWYGAIYYEIIPLQSGNRTYYTLLGMNFNNLFSNEKVIEVLEVKKNNKITFGARIFQKYPKGKVARVIFEYNKDAVLNLKFENHPYKVSTGKRNPKTKRIIYETVFSDMIVFDQLIPMDETMPVIPAFMVPESSLSQGFIPKDGKWQFISKINTLNPPENIPSTEVKRRKYYDPIQ